MQSHYSIDILFSNTEQHSVDMSEKKGRRVIVDSDEEEDVGVPQASTLEDDVFGDDDNTNDKSGAKEDNEDSEKNDDGEEDEDDEDDKPSKTVAADDSESDLSDIENDNLFGDAPDTRSTAERLADENEDEFEEIEQQELEIALPRFPPAIKPNEKLFLSRVPAFLQIDPHPFDSSEFLKSAEEGNKDADTSKSLRLKTQAENTLRWKYGKGGDGSTVTKESNARFVKWSDGSLSLQLGEELFDVIRKPVEDTSLALSHPEQEVLQTSGVLSENFSYVPTSTKSLTHKRLTEALAKRTLKSAAVSSWDTTDDPDKVQREAEKAENMANAARRKLESKRRQAEEDFGKTAADAMAEDEEMEHNYESRNAYEEDDFVVDDDEEEDDEEEERAKRLQKLKSDGAKLYKNRRDLDEDDEDEEEVGVKKRRVIDSDDDE